MTADLITLNGTKPEEEKVPHTNGEVDEEDDDVEDDGAPENTGATGAFP